MIKTDDHWGMRKEIVLIVHDELERVLASSSIKENKEFVILKLVKVVAFVQIETPSRPRFVIKTTLAQGMTRFGRCYTPEELAHGGKIKDQGKRLISKGEAEEFWRKMQPKDYLIVKHLEKNQAQISI